MNWLSFKWMTINIEWAINDAKKYNHRSVMLNLFPPTKFMMLKSQPLVSQNGI